jgi:hypothetical protein
VQAHAHHAGHSMLAKVVAWPPSSSPEFPSTVQTLNVLAVMERNISHQHPWLFSLDHHSTIQSLLAPR